MRRAVQIDLLEDESKLSDNPQELKRMIAETHRQNKVVQTSINQYLKNNQAKRLQNKKLRSMCGALQTQMQKFVDQHMRQFEQKIAAERLPQEHPGTQFGFSPFALTKLQSFKYQQSDDATICLVCYAELEKNARCKRLPSCKHVFHSQCIKQHLMVSKYCPGCGMQVHL